VEKNANTNVPDNKYGGTFEFYFYGVTGQRLLTMAVAYGEDGNIAVNYPAATETAVYFGGKLISKNGVTIVTDRLGSVRANSNGERLNYWPWGEERGTSTDRREKFATYFRDAAGQDYAEQRYYDNGKGRFWSPDPLGLRGAVLSDPGSWNRYAYVEGDPVNFYDPFGLLMQVPTGGPSTGINPPNPPDPNPSSIGTGGNDMPEPVVEDPQQQQGWADAYRVQTSQFEATCKVSGRFHTAQPNANSS